MASDAAAPSLSTTALTIGALGIVFGDIGTSPLYAMRESFDGGGHTLAVSEANVHGILSLILWSLLIVISVKYLAFVMRADNEGEGGILALTVLLRPADGHPRQGEPSSPPPARTGADRRTPRPDGGSRRGGCRPSRSPPAGRGRWSAPRSGTPGP